MSEPSKNLEGLMELLSVSYEYTLKFLSEEKEPSKSLEDTRGRNNGKMEYIFREGFSETCQEKPLLSTDASIFDYIPEIPNIEHYEMKVNSLNLNSLTRRRDQIFKRMKKDQEEKIMQRKRELERQNVQRAETRFQTKSQITYGRSTDPLQRVDKLIINPDDMDKLKPEIDLNDTIILHYINFLQLELMPPQISTKVYFFSSFFLERLVGEYLKDECLNEKQSLNLYENMATLVRENYHKVKRWTKKIDLFEKDYIVIPINAFRHWYCMIIVNPKRLLENGEKAVIAYCDSMFEKRNFVSQAVRKYFEIELEEKKQVHIDLNESNMPCYQLLLPRQTNTHDCGLYMLTYIQSLLNDPQELRELQIVARRKKLTLFPRSLIFTMRERLRRLLIRLSNCKSESDRRQIAEDYKLQRARLLLEADKDRDFDEINERQLKKFERLNHKVQNDLAPEERAYLFEVKFHLDSEINFYEKDK